MPLRDRLHARAGLQLGFMQAGLRGFVDSLGRGLVLTDYCTVDGIVESLKRNDYSARTLIKEVIFSKPFQYQGGLVSKNATPEKRISQGAQ